MRTICADMSSLQTYNKDLSISQKRIRLVYDCRHICLLLILYWLFRNNLCDIDNVCHTDFAYHSDVCRSISMFHTFFTHVATHMHRPSLFICIVPPLLQELENAANPGKWNPIGLVHSNISTLQIKHPACFSNVNQKHVIF
jgi:hypothetical protein